MATVTVMPEPTEDEKWRKCPTRGCLASFDLNPHDFIVSGDGDWMHTIVCRKCLHVREKVPEGVLGELLVEQFAATAPHVTLRHVAHFLEVRRRWWAAKVAVEERFD